MIVSPKAASLALATALVMAATAAAQTPACVINIAKNNKLKDANQALLRLMVPGVTRPADQPRLAQTVMKSLNDKPEKMDVVTRAYVAGQLYSWWTARGSGAVTVSRAELGLPDNPTGTVDVLASMDSALKVVERSSPACADSTETARRGAWVPFINAAAELVNSDKLDSAEVMMRRADIAWTGAPHTAFFRAIAAQKKNDMASAIAAHRRAFDLVPKQPRDTTFLAIRSQAMYNYAVLLAAQTEQQEGEQKKATAKQAVEALRAWIAENPKDQNLASAQSLAASLTATTGDTVALASMYGDMLANPSKYSTLQIFEAATNAYRADRPQDAVKLFELGLKDNPLYRDALFNSAITYSTTKQFDKMVEAARKLVEVDPNNPDNWQLLAIGYKGLADANKNAAGKKAQIDSVVKFIEKYQKLPNKVSFSLFSHDGATHTLGGNVENRTDLPVTYNLKFEFLDKTGAVVATKDATVGPVEPRKSAPFRVQVEKSGIVAFRYAPF